MKNTVIKKILSGLCAGAMICTPMTSCSKKPKDTKVEIKISASKSSIEKRRSCTLTSKDQNGNIINGVKYKTSDESIAKVEGNKVIGYSVGKVTITGYKDNCVDGTIVITVTNVLVEDIYFEYEDQDVYLQYNNPLQLTAFVIPNDADNQDLEWESDNKCVSVQDGLLEATQTSGEANITVYDASRKYSASCKVIISDEIPVTNVQFEQNLYSKPYYENYKFKIDPIIKPSNASIKSMQWSVDEAGSSVINITDNNEIEVLSPGYAELKLSVTDKTDKTLSSTCLIRVVSTNQDSFQWEYDEANQTATLKGLVKGKQDLNNIVVPKEVSKDNKTYTVTSLYDAPKSSLGVFSQNQNIKSVWLPDTIKSISSYCFYGCSQLNEINFSNQLTNINKYAFFNCSSLDNVVIPDKVKSIGDWSFYKCTNLKYLMLPCYLEQIGKYAFSNCESLTDTSGKNKGLGINFNNSVEQWKTNVTLDDLCFDDCNTQQVQCIDGTTNLN